MAKKPKVDLGDIGRWAEKQLAAPKNLVEKVRRATEGSLSTPKPVQGYSAYAPKLNSTSQNAMTAINAIAEAGAKSGANEYTGVADLWRLTMDEGNPAVNAAWLAANFLPGAGKGATKSAVKGLKKAAPTLGKIGSRAGGDVDTLIRAYVYSLLGKQER